MSTSAGAHIRRVLHHTEPPPPVQARFFYTSPIPIDDPLSPVPPPTTAQAASREPPKPFSEYDNAALDRAWLDLRRKIHRYNEERSERGRAKGQASTRAGSSVGRDDGGGSGSRPATPRVRPSRPAASSLGQVDASPPPTPVDLPVDPPADDEASDAPALVPEAANDPSTTGTPFIRAPSRKQADSGQREARPSRPEARTHDTYEWDDPSHLAGRVPSSEKRDVGSERPASKVAVGVSRLHQVEMPGMQMTPIYWTPVQDNAEVVRATWFYHETMLPVETPVANMLEAGYVNLQCWTETWKDELNSAVDVGAAGEMKIVHKLWPEKAPKPPGSRSSSRPVSMSRENLLRTATFNLVEGEPETPERLREKAVEAAREIVDVSTGPDGADNKATGTSTYGLNGAVRTYASFGVIYANRREARLLKPSLMPSDYYGRRPLANYIRKGYKLGIPVVRGFDQKKWDKLHPPQSGPRRTKAARGTAASASDASPGVRRDADPELAKSERPDVTDLIFVIHGIGQKLSQRMESFHFTHAINAFRREVNIEVGSKEVKARFRRDMGGIMVLPINWRHSLSFEEGGYRDDDDPGVNEFSLKDITPDTLPSVRNIISDVMLDIPYYMSHHQPKMIAAVIREANGVYRLWCRNNPGFARDGRVHIIAHSLGSVMAVDILSRQPTAIPEHLSDPAGVDLDADPLDHFLFDTSNLFLAGSPAGFFLLLKKSQLLPRIDRARARARARDSQPAPDAGTNNPSICGERGTYGCLAVDNLYNVINPYDPVAYRMNAAVDTAYAASLRQATIPSATPGWFGVGTKSGSVFGGSGGGGSAAGHPSSSSSSSSHPPLPRLPSNVELETHNFTREERAEKRMHLLNDNGQVDFFLQYGGGAFAIQYLTMLGAHSSYWVLRDFVRFVVTETGREGGVDGTFLGLRAVKKKKRLALG